MSLCAPCPQPQEFKARDHSKSCSQEPVGVCVGIVRMSVGVHHLSILASWAFDHHIF